MSDPREYKSTFMDRHGPSGADFIRTLPYCLISFGLVFGALSYYRGITIATVLISLIAGVGTGWFASSLSESAGAAYKHFMVDGASTPYVEQYSYQQALVMRGQIDEALESFEAVIAEQPEAIDARIKAAELYAKERQNFSRAAELFQGVQRIPAANVGQSVYVTNRLVDLYTGPLNDPGKALVELRRLIDKYPGSAAAANAKDALATLKARHVEKDVSS